MANTDKLIEHAQPHLNQGEIVRAAVRGTYETKRMGTDTARSGILLATDERLVFFAKKLGGYDLESFPYSNISSFEQSTSISGHSVTFFATGNRVHVKWIKSLPDLAEVTTAVKAAMGQGKSRETPAVPTATTENMDDVFGQLRQLGELRDAGIVTLEEFEAKKAELLARL